MEEARVKLKTLLSRETIHVFICVFAGTSIGFVVLFLGTLIVMIGLLYAYVRQRRVVKTFETLP